MFVADSTVSKSSGFDSELKKGEETCSLMWMSVTERAALRKRGAECYLRPREPLLIIYQVLVTESGHPVDKSTRVRSGRQIGVTTHYSDFGCAKATGTGL